MTASQERILAALQQRGPGPVRVGHLFAKDLSMSFRWLCCQVTALERQRRIERCPKRFFVQLVGVVPEPQATRSQERVLAALQQRGPGHVRVGHLFAKDLGMSFRWLCCQVTALERQRRIQRCPERFFVQLVGGKQS